MIAGAQEGKIGSNCVFSPAVKSWVPSYLVTPEAIKRMQRGMDDPLAAWWDKYRDAKLQTQRQEDAAVKTYLGEDARASSDTSSALSIFGRPGFAQSPIGGGSLW